MLTLNRLTRRCQQLHDSPKPALFVVPPRVTVGCAQLCRGFPQLTQGSVGMWWRPQGSLGHLQGFLVFCCVESSSRVSLSHFPKSQTEGQSAFVVASLGVEVWHSGEHFGGFSTVLPHSPSTERAISRPPFCNRDARRTVCQNAESWTLCPCPFSPFAGARKLAL